MKIDGVPGEYFAQALVFVHGSGWKLTEEYFRDKKSVFIHRADAETEDHIKWPVEIMDGIAYVPSDEEMEDAH
jgi:hypothetical protein